ncbi:nucleoporin nup44 [Verticillium alfalfae VaMs.102]|uniref:Nucleoporin nup44 n=1 Tax=Verticillium alfalfae (strain VaMs.102 / ATCC MYA-4576 / FGSC 10136) TaxID=526221 RepID=C9S9T7_VERA1|nr:nucleoporin nup44 [Verticillium alfalfae VaMs.102]EEY16150.1 nucleoporin nup44 [Verticillium alfalfae VaMs.102]
MSLFGKPAGQAGGLFGASTFGQSQQQQQPQQQQQAAPTLSLFGGQQNQTNQQQNQGTSSLFGGSFAQPQQQQQQQQVQQSQQQQMPSLAQSQAQLSSSLWQPGSETPQNQKPPMEQIATTFRKWHPGDPSCVFRHYFYNKVDNAAVPFYQPGPNEDPKEWEEALQRKPGQGYIPVLGAGFSGVADRLQTQKRVVGEHNVRLHQINASLDAILSRHDLETSVRALAARRRHVALRERCLALAARVQVLRNRGYALSGDEDDLRLKLVELDRAVQDPALSAREEELWSRPYCAAWVLEDYEKQIQHLKKEVESITKDFQEWESDGAAR